MRIPITASILTLTGALAVAGCGDSEPAEGADYEEAQVDQRVEPAPEPMTATPDYDGAPAGPGEREVGESPWVETTVINSNGESIGTLSIEPLRQGVRLAMHVEGLAPGTHAVHIHEHGVCEPPDFKSAGGHFNPADAQHGMPDIDEDFDDPDHHAGDMLNQKVNDQELLDTVFINDSVTLSGGQPNSLIEGDGTALVIHARADDYESQPSGAAGDRVACAPITSNTTVGTR